VQGVVYVQTFFPGCEYVPQNLGFEASRLNNRNDAVGGDQLWTEGITYNINDLIDPSLGLTITGTSDINDLGQILAFGVYANGSSASVILTPIDEPPILTLLSIVLGALAWSLRRQRLLLTRS
jgi:hypothetical protein